MPDVCVCGSYQVRVELLVVPVMVRILWSCVCVKPLFPRTQCWDFEDFPKMCSLLPFLFPPVRMTLLSRSSLGRPGEFQHQCEPSFHVPPAGEGACRTVLPPSSSGFRNVCPLSQSCPNWIEESASESRCTADTDVPRLQRLQRRPLTDQSSHSPAPA